MKRKTRQAFEQINFLEHSVFILLRNHVTWAPSVVEGKEAIKLIPGLASCFSHEGPLAPRVFVATATSVGERDWGEEGVCLRQNKNL